MGPWWGDGAFCKCPHALGPSDVTRTVAVGDESCDPHRLETEEVTVHGDPFLQEILKCPLCSECHSCLSDSLRRSLSEKTQPVCVTSSFALLSQVPSQRIEYFKR